MTRFALLASSALTDLELDRVVGGFGMPAPLPRGKVSTAPADAAAPDHIEHQPASGHGPQVQGTVPGEFSQDVTHNPNPGTATPPSPDHVLNTAPQYGPHSPVPMQGEPSQGVIFNPNCGSGPLSPDQGVQITLPATWGGIGPVVPQAPVPDSVAAPAFHGVGPAVPTQVIPDDLAGQTISSVGPSVEAPVAAIFHGSR